MFDWNVIISVYDEGYRRAVHFLEKFGSVRKTEFFNVLAMKVDDLPTLLETLRERQEQDPDLFENVISRLIPLTATFVFQTPIEFEARAKEIVSQWLPSLATKSFHVRMHRRDLDGRLSSHNEERFLGRFLLQRLEESGTPGVITFEDPDAIIALETLGQQAGLALWLREDLQRYPFLKLD